MALFASQVQRCAGVLVAPLQLCLRFQQQLYDVNVVVHRCEMQRRSFLVAEGVCVSLSI